VKDRRAFLAKVFSYTYLVFGAVGILSSLPRFTSTANRGGALLMIGFLAGTAVVIFLYPNMLKVLSGVPYWWEVAVVLALSALVAGFAGVTRLSFARMDADPLTKLSDYITVAAAGLFVLINIVAIIITARAGSVRPDIGGSRRQD
jgi:hypothetical protein